MSHHVIVIGGGHNGLVCATYLARAGRAVTVLERSAVLGGLAAPREFHKGFTVPGLLHDTACLRPSVVQELGLEGHGLSLRDAPGIYAPEAAGPGVVLHRDPEAAKDELARHSASDLGAYRDYRALIDRARSFFASVVDKEPPELADAGWATIFQLLTMGMDLRRLGTPAMSEIMRVPTMTVADWLRERFSSDLIVSALAAPALYASWCGPHSPSTTASLLIHEVMAQREVVGGPSGLIRALERAAEAAGVTIRTGATVRSVRQDGGRAVGVELADGEQLDGLVVSSADPRTTILDLVDARSVPSDLAHSMSRYRMRGTTAKLHLALKGRLEWSARPAEDFERVRICEDIDTFERAFDAVKYGRISDRPHLEVSIPTVSDPSLAPEGAHVASVLVHFAPYHLRGGWTDEARGLLFERTLETLARHAPNLRDAIVGHELLTPVDFEQQLGITEGHLWHGEYGLDQLMSMRPIATCASHKTPIPGLFLCGSGSHPGGGITGGPGRLGAQAVLND